MNLRHSNSKVLGSWIFHIVEVKLIKLLMVLVVDKEWNLMSRSLDGVVVQKHDKW
jgi:hypothetical protein